MTRLIIGAALVALFSVPAIAQVRTSDPYAANYWYGALDYGHASISGLSLDGGNIALGYRWRYFGLEGGDFISSKYGATINSAYIDLITPLPLTRRFTAILSAGTAYSTVSASAGNLTASLSSPAWRLGAALETRITHRLDFRLAYHYLNHTESGWGSANEIQAGLAFRF